MNTATRLTAALALAATLTACAGSDEYVADTAALDTASAAGAVVTPGVATSDTGLIHVPLNEWTVTVSQSTIAAGTRTFHAMNQGTMTHAFEIEGNGMEWKSDAIPPGGTATLTPTLTAGTYEVYCPITDSQGNHQQKGMRTTFTVQ